METVKKKCWYCWKIKNIPSEDILCKKCAKLKKRPVETKVYKIYDTI